ncbi:hypothetical protein GJAV_G00074650 [Gymnothorax javanicus]|nr:hypothetical protein GJAV_G00074650 [Gymnothorax javanicus]
MRGILIIALGLERKRDIAANSQLLLKCFLSPAFCKFYLKPTPRIMRFSVLFLFLILACLYLSLAQGTYENCCLTYVGRVKAPIKKRVVNYRMQENDGGCNIPAVVFIMRSGKAFCADPSDFWVKRLIKHIDKKKLK